MAAEIDHRDYLIAIIDDLLPVFVLILVEPLGKDLLAFFSETQNFLADWACSTWLLLMKVVKDSNSCTSIAVISNSFGKDRDKGWFSCIDIANDAYFDQLFWSLFLVHHQWYSKSNIKELQNSVRFTLESHHLSTLLSISDAPSHVIYQKWLFSLQTWKLKTSSLCISRRRSIYF